MTKSDKKFIAILASVTLAIAPVTIACATYSIHEGQRNNAITVCQFGGVLDKTQCAEEVDKIHTNLGDSYSKIVDYEKLLNRLPTYARPSGYEILKIALVSSFMCDKYGTMCLKD